MNTVTHFRYTADSTETVEAALEYVPAASGGWCVICGSLPAQDPHAGRGITVPEEIDGTPVTELHTAWYGPLDFISGPGPRKAHIHFGLHTQDPLCSEQNLSPIVIHGPLQSLSLYASGRLTLGLCSDHLRDLRVDSGDLCILENGFRHCPALESACFFGTIAELRPHAFEGCRHLETVMLPADLTCIPDYCFSNCTALSHDPLPRSLRRIGRGAFAACGRLRLAQLPPKLTAIGTRAFYGVPLPSPLYLPPEVSELENQALGANPQLVIRGIPGTAAERYAQAHGLEFRP